ncbi:MAG: hypothetical protein RBG13Loki_0183, partial [Promethearchaeota archaeon CR_4]
MKKSKDDEFKQKRKELKEFLANLCQEVIYSKE